MNKLILPLLIFIISGCRSYNFVEKTSYNFDVKIIPSEEKIVSELQLCYLNPYEKSDSITFLLHRNLAIDSLSGDRIAGFSLDTTLASPLPFTPEAARLVIKLKNPAIKDEIINFRIRYSGKIGIVSQWKINRIQDDWVELGLYSPWFPFDPNLKELSYIMRLSLPEGYRASVNGASEYKKGIYRTHNPGADNDIVITASKNMKDWKYSDDKLSLNLYSAAEISDSTAGNILKLGKNIFRNYMSWFGIKDGIEASVVVSPRETGGGYARKGFIVLSKISDQDFAKSKTGYTSYFAHEFAHLWFSNAPKDSWEDWLNESFAEYASLMMVRQTAGEKEFISRVNGKKEKIGGLPRLRGIDRKSEEAYPVLYNKGCCYLYELEQELGKDEFMNLIRWVAINRVNSTGSFLEELERRYGKTLAADFNAKLDM